MDASAPLPPPFSFDTATTDGRAVARYFRWLPPDSPELRRLWRKLAPPDEATPPPDACGLEVRRSRISGIGSMLFALVWTGITWPLGLIFVIPFLLNPGSESPAALFFLIFMAIGVYLLVTAYRENRYCAGFFVNGDCFWMGVRLIRRNIWIAVPRGGILRLEWTKPFLPRNENGTPGKPEDDWELLLHRRDAEPTDLYRVGSDSGKPTVKALSWIGQRIADWAGVEFDPYRPDLSLESAGWEGEIPPLFTALPPGSPELADAWRDLSPPDETPPAASAFGLAYRDEEMQAHAWQFVIASLITAATILFLLFGLELSVNNIIPSNPAGRGIVLLIAVTFFWCLCLGVSCELSDRWRRTAFFFDAKRLLRRSRLGWSRREIAVMRGDIERVVFGCPIGESLNWFLRLVRHNDDVVELFSGSRVDDTPLPPQVRWLGGRIAEWAGVPYEHELPPIDIDEDEKNEDNESGDDESDDADPK